MNVVIIGATGLVGNTAFAEFSKDKKYTVIGTCFSQKNSKFIHIDIRNKKDILKLMEKLKPDVIIHAAANPNVEYCEVHPEETRHINIDGSRNLISAAKKFGTKFVFFSSEYVFDGIKGPYSEEDEPNPINEYGTQKLAVESIIETRMKDYLIIRITVVYGIEPRGKNFVMQVIKNLNNGISMKIPCDQISSPTYVVNMIQAVKNLVENKKSGIYHVVGSELADRYTFAKTIADVFNLDKNLLIPVKTRDLGQRAKRPLNAGMKIAKVQKDVLIHLMNIKEGLEEMKRNWSVKES